MNAYTQAYREPFQTKRIEQGINLVCRLVVTRVMPGIKVVRRRKTTASVLIRLMPFWWMSRSDASIRRNKVGRRLVPLHLLQCRAESGIEGGPKDKLDTACPF